MSPCVALSPCLDFSARECTLNIARLHIFGILGDWSVARTAQEHIWVLACCILPFDLELAPRLIALTASSCVVVCAKVWIARLYCDATLKLGQGDLKLVVA